MVSQIYLENVLYEFRGLKAMADKAKLNDMVNNLVDQKPEEAAINFHDYLQTKMSEVIGGEGKNETENKDNEE